MFVALVLVAMLAPVVRSAPAAAQGAANFVFHGGGWGHGVGMSQNGARNMAAQGYGHVGILNFYYPNTAILPTQPLDNIRVHVGDATRVEFSSEGSLLFERNGVGINSLGSGTIQVSAQEGGLQIGSVWTPTSPGEPVMLSFPQPVKISNNGHRYQWGKMQLTVKNGKVRVVEILGLEEYVAGISEMPAAWPLEALMAQAIAARTYAHEVTLHRRASTEWAQEYDISGTTVDQNYIGWDAQDSAWDQKWLAAVKSTAGVEIVDSAGPVRAYYSASNGGWTETAAYVFANDVAHTVAGPDPFDAGGHNWTEWTRTYSQAAMSRWLGAHGDTSVGTLTAINVLGGEGASARIDQATVELVGTGGTKRVTGRRLMVVMNAGIFGQGLGLDDHLPGTFVTIGNGSSNGYPQPSGQAAAPQATPDPVEGSDTDGAVVPDGLGPAPGTGVAPLTVADGSADADADADAASDTADAESDAADESGDTTTEATDQTSFAPSPDSIRPGTGVALQPAPAAPDAAPEPGTGVAPIPADSSGADTSATETPEAAPGTGVAPLQLDSGSASGTTTPPEGTRLTPGTGVAPAPAATGTGGGDASAPLPEGAEVAAGTGVAPLAASEAAGLASAVLLVTRTADVDTSPAQFRVITPTEALADEAEARLSQLSTQAAVALFADFDIDGYVAAVAPRPVHGVCTATDWGITCVSLNALEALQNGTDEG
jgi:stage II sporulation protein D